MFKWLKALHPAAVACGLMVHAVAGPPTGSASRSTDSTWRAGMADRRRFGHFVVSPE
jgi:hypothetical protein